MEAPEERIVLTEAQVVQMVAHALREKPLEACGIIAGRGSVARWVAEAANTARSSVEFYVEPRQQLEIFDRIEREGLELLAIYHSHPASDERPSDADIDRAFYPDAVHVIVSLSAREPVVAGYRIRNGKVDVVEIAVARDGDHDDGAVRHSSCAS